MRFRLAKAIILGLLIFSSGCIREKEIAIEDPIIIGSQFLVSENSKSSISFKSSLKDLDVRIINQAPSNAGRLEINDQTITVEAFEVDRPGLIDAVIFSKEKGPGDGTARFFSIAVKNTSALKIEEKVTNILNKKNDLLMLAEDYTAYKFILDVAYLNKFIDYNEKQSRISVFNPTDSGYFYQSITALEALKDTRQKYMASESSDEDLVSSIDSLISVLNSHSNYGDSIILSINEFYRPFIPDFSKGDFAYNPKKGLSKYIGNEDLGRYEDKEWIFDPEYSLLNALFNN